MKHWAETTQCAAGDDLSGHACGAFLYHTYPMVILVSLYHTIGTPLWRPLHTAQNPCTLVGAPFMAPAS
ncbi:hypothetical protein, partial [Megasphaera cerevisiae]|uniref:hypothetical protein n=1 Tax=Megasphaera cerevisiae TaxID=39029 RepID=UPI001F37108A